MKNREQRDLLSWRAGDDDSSDAEAATAHGYALAQHIKRTSNDLLQIEKARSIPLWQRLLKEELVKRVGHFVDEPPRADLQVDSSGSEARSHEVSRLKRC